MSLVSEVFHFSGIIGGVRASIEVMSTDAATPVTAPGPGKLPTDPAVAERLFAELLEAVAGLRQENAELRQKVEQLIRQRYGPRPDHFNPNQPLLFPELQPNAPADAATTPPEPDAPVPPVDDTPKKKKKGHGRRRLEDLLPNLPVVRRAYELTEAERTCPCCGGLRHKIGEQTTQQLEYEPARLLRVEHAQFTYSCPHCPEHICTAPKPPQPIDRGLPGPGLLAAIVTHKHDEHQPLYRQELGLWRSGLFLSRSTQCTWMAATAALLQPLVGRFTYHILQGRVVQTDSTPVSVLIDGRDTAQTGHLWPYVGDAQHPYVVFDFSTDRTKEHPHKFLAEYTGYVQADACSGYDGLFEPGAKFPKVEVGCWAHTERYYQAAKESDPALACHALAFIGTLFAIEKRNRDNGLSEADVLAVRQHKSLPILAEFKQWLDAVKDQPLPQSPLGKAITYTRNQWQALNRYTEAGFLGMDNNASERMNKIIARGRNNWLFLGSPQGGATAAILFSITATCRRLEMDAFAYLRDVLTRLPALRAAHPRNRMPPELLNDLLPDRWLAAHPDARFPPQRRQSADRSRNRAPP